MVMVHGRGATAESILTLVPALSLPGFAYLAPQAAGNTWYPYSFLVLVEKNEPGISSGIQAINDLLARIVAAGLPPERTILLGFSQGACLATEYAARHARRYGGTPRNYPGSLERTPVFLGCSDADPHIPAARVLETTDVMRKLDGQVTMRLYPGMGHLINEDEIAAVRQMMTGLTGARVP
jgi:predicted esterase